MNEIKKRADIAVLVGQTAIGKTNRAISIAKMIDAEIVSADSVQVYKRMNIGSAKPILEEMQGVVHHMIDVIDPSDNDFTVSRYQKMAFECIEDIKSRGKRVLVVGGTGLYIQSLCNYMDFAGIGQDLEFRQKWIEKDKKERGSAHRKLENIDPISASKIHENDLKRTVRALEIALHTDKSKYELNEDDEDKMPRYNCVQAGLIMDRAELYARINIRVDKMIERGLVEEVQGLLNSGVSQRCRSMQALGYKEIVEYLEDRADIEDAIADLKQGTRRFAKRQNTWFKRDERISWFEVGDYDGDERLCSAICEYYLKEL